MTIVDSLLHGTSSETQAALQHRHHLRLIDDDHIPAVESANEAVLSQQQGLTDNEIERWNCIVDQANQLIDNLALIHQIMGDDDSPSQYRPAYTILWHQYEGDIASLWGLEPEAVMQFRDRVMDRSKDLAARIDDLLDDWDSAYSYYLEQTIARYERNHDLMVALDKDWALLNAEETARLTKELLATRGWCLWQCRELDGETVAIVRDGSVHGVPPSYPVFMRQELRRLFRHGVPGSALRLVLAAKRTDEVVVTRGLSPKCHCGSTDLWLRSASRYGPAQWMCSRCHPEPRATSKHSRMNVLNQTEYRQ